MHKLTTIKYSIKCHFEDLLVDGFACLRLENEGFSRIIFGKLFNGIVDHIEI